MPVLKSHAHVTVEQIAPGREVHLLLQNPGPEAVTLLRIDACCNVEIPGLTVRAFSSPASLTPIDVSLRPDIHTEPPGASVALILATRDSDTIVLPNDAALTLDCPIYDGRGKKPLTQDAIELVAGTCLAVVTEEPVLAREIDLLMYATQPRDP